MRTRSPWALGLLLALGACGVEGDLPMVPDPPPPPEPPTEASLLLSLDPSPIEAVVDEGSPVLSAEWTVTVKEGAGIGGNIDFVRATLTDSEGGSIAETELGAEQVSEQLGGSNHIEGGSSQDLLMSLSYEFPAEVLSGDLLVTVQLGDDNGNTVSAEVDDVIQICIPRLLAPEEGEALDNGCTSTNQENGIRWDFEWSECSDADFYHIEIRRDGEGAPRVDESDLTATTFTVLEDRFVPEDSRFGWFWTVRANINGTWGAWSPDRSFEVEPNNTDCVVP